MKNDKLAKIAELKAQIDAKERELQSMKQTPHSPMLEKALTDQIKQLKNQLAGLTGPSFL